LGEKQAANRAVEIPPEELGEVMAKRRALAAEQLSRLEQLWENPVTRDALTEAEVRQQRLLVEQIDAEIVHNDNKTDAAKVAQSLASEAARQDSVMARISNQGLVEADPGEVLHRTAELARLVAEATTVKAPIAGKILEIYARPGERVANTPLLLMADLSRMVCVAEVHEADLKHVQTQEQEGRLIPARPYRAALKSAALEKDLQGTVTEVGRLIGAPKLRDPNPLAPRDVRTAQVTIELDDESTGIARRYVHLQVNVTIDLGQDAKAPRD
jgi:HlyD family secretion protein